MKLSLKNRFLLPTMILLILGMGLSMLISYLNARNALDAVIKAQITQTAASLNETLTSWIERSQLDLTIWSAMKVYQTAVQDTFAGRAAQKAASDELAILREEYTLYESLLVVNTQGDVVASSSPELIGTVNLADQQAIQEALNGQVFFSDAMPDGIIGNPACMIAAPLKEREAVVGVLLGIVDLIYLGQTYVAPVKIGQSGYAYLLDHNGLVIAYPDQTQLLKHAAGNVTDGSQMLSAHAVQMSQGAAEQAAATEEASASVEQMLSTIRQNAQNATRTEKSPRKPQKTPVLPEKPWQRLLPPCKKLPRKLLSLRQLQIRPVYSP